ncbi:MAG: tetratricopeptide repeat protein [Nitrospirae bacterium]|nr:tetratricopeptide repeat protein [Nitrospirota bacterium]
MWSIIGAGVLLGVAAVWILLTPDNPLTSLFRGKISDTGGKVIIGPYPVESDFEILRGHGVKTIASLLDPRVPYEAVLLKREKTLGEKYGVTVINLPMASILGKALGADAEQRAAEAAAGIAGIDGKVYVHCYLGIHRVARVKALLDARGTESGSYLIRQGDRSQDTRLLDRAQQEFDERKYAQVIETLSGIAAPEPPAFLLRGWAAYHTGDMGGARIAFESALKDLPESTDGQLGLGYTALRQNDLSTADVQFSSVLKGDPANVSGLIGLGHVRFRQGNSQEAALRMETVLKLDPQNQEALELLGKVQAGRKK